MQKIKLLVAEDEPTTQKIYSRGLPEAVFELKIADQGTAALKTYLQWQPDIVVLDIRMPRMTGYSVLKQIRQTYDDSETTVIMSTGVSDKDDVMACIKLGIQGYIVKPIRIGDIGEKILAYFQKIDPSRAHNALLNLKEARRNLRAARKKKAPRDSSRSQSETPTEITPPPVETHSPSE